MPLGRGPFSPLVCSTRERNGSRRPAGSYVKPLPAMTLSLSSMIFSMVLLSSSFFGSFEEAAACDPPLSAARLHESAKARHVADTSRRRRIRTLLSPLMAGSLLVVDKRGGRERGADAPLAGRVGGDLDVVHVDDARILADAIEEHSQVVIVAHHVHVDGEFAVELHGAQGPRIETLQIEIRLIGEIFHPFEQLARLGLRGENLEKILELFLKVRDLLLKLGEFGLDRRAPTNLRLELLQPLGVGGILSLHLAEVREGPVGYADKDGAQHRHQRHLTPQRKVFEVHALSSTGL